MGQVTQEVGVSNLHVIDRKNNNAKPDKLVKPFKPVKP